MSEVVEGRGQWGWLFADREVFGETLCGVWGVIFIIEDIAKMWAFGTTHGHAMRSLTSTEQV